jgi:hypothetical protein
MLSHVQLRLGGDLPEGREITAGAINLNLIKISFKK